MAVSRPLVEVFQEFSRLPAETVQPRRALVIGGNAYLHRYANEKSEIGLGAYNRLDDVNYPWPSRHAGGVVDADSVRLFADNALLLYFEDLIGQTSGGKGTVTPVSGKKNRIRSSVVNFASNGDNARSSLLYDRDVKIGDRVYLRGVFDPEGDCEEVELWTYVTGLIADVEDGTIEDCAAASSNKDATEMAASAEQIAGPINCVEVAADGSEYNGLADGYPSETYTVEVVKSSVSGCSAARLRVLSASGLDDEDEVEPAAFGEPTSIGSRGLTVTFSLTTGTCSTSADSSGVSSDELVVGQKFRVTVSQDFEPPCCDAGGTYTGTVDDTYIIEVTKGGTWAEAPEITVTTAKGLDVSGPTIVTDANTDINIGTKGLTLQFVDCYGDNVSQASFEGADSGGDETLAGLCKGDKFSVVVATGLDGPIRELVLRHDVPLRLLDADDLDLRLFIQVSHLEIDADRASAPPLQNFEIEETQIIVKSGITSYESTWTNNGSPLPLLVYTGDLYVQYREWLPTASEDLNFIADVADLDDIPGQLDPDNPLKYGVFLALLNSNGTKVGYIAVADPLDIESWQNVTERTDGRVDIYNPVPLTHDQEVLLLFQAHVDAESGPEQGAWKGMFVNLQAVSEKMIVGKSTAAVQALTPTSEDGNVVLATLEDDPDADGTQYTLLSCTSGNSNFITYGVSAGCRARFLYTIDAFGNEDYSEFVVDAVLSENTLRLLSGHTSAVTVAQKVEIWKPLTKAQMAADLAAQASAFADWRVCATFPDRFSSSGVTVDGYFLGCIAAGAISGILPHQSLTNLQVHGIDDAASRTIKLFSETQLQTIEDGGVMIFSEDRNGTPFIRHGLTTDTSDLQHSEEMLRRNLDDLSIDFKLLIEPYIGRANVTPTMLAVLEQLIRDRLRYHTTFAATPLLGPRLIAGDIARGNDGQLLLQPYALSADTVEIVLDLTLPAPMNRVRLHLLVS